MRTRIAFLAATAALVAVPAAEAHVTANPTEGPAGGFTMVSFRVPHGCEDSPTTSLSVRIPAGVVFVTPQAVTGWKVTTKSGEFATPVESHGDTITEGVQEVTWDGGSLDPHEFTDFGISMALPDTPGETLYFPVVQRCAQGITRWIQIPVDGQEEPETPAPGVELVASAESETAAADAAATEEDDDGDGLVYAALALGAAGLIAGLGALGLTWQRGRHA